jgi:hypothetical protein
MGHDMSAKRGHRRRQQMDKETAQRAVARIDDLVKTALVKRARKFGMTEAEGIKLAESWHTARETVLKPGPERGVR